MNLKKSPFEIQDKKLRDLDNAKEYPTLKDLIKEQGVSSAASDVYKRQDQTIVSIASIET